MYVRNVRTGKVTVISEDNPHLRSLLASGDVEEVTLEAADDDGGEEE